MKPLIWTKIHSSLGDHYVSGKYQIDCGRTQFFTQGYTFDTLEEAFEYVQRSRIAELKKEFDLLEIKSVEISEKSCKLYSDGLLLGHMDSGIFWPSGPLTLKQLISIYFHDKESG